MSDGPSLLRRTFLGGSVLAAVGQYSRAVSAQERKSLEDYANDSGYIDRDGVFQAVQDRREGIITESLLNRVVRYWRAGEPVVGGGTANPAQLIESHIDTLGSANFTLDIQEYRDINSAIPTKKVEFQWDDANQRSQLTESSKQNQEVDVSQQFTQDSQHVDIKQNNRRVNQATLPIDKGPVYIDGRKLLDELLIGASLSFERLVSTEDGSLSKYSISNHRRLSEASGHVIGDNGEYISEIEIQWMQSDGQQSEIDIYTEKDISGSLSSLRMSNKGNRTAASGNNSVKPAFFHDDEVTASINDVEPATGEYGVGEEVVTRATVTNTGSSEHTFFIGYDLIGPDGENYNNNAETGFPTPIDSGGEIYAKLEWEVQDNAPNGTYDVVVAVWKEHDRDSLSTRLDERTIYDTFTVKQTAEYELDIDSEDGGGLEIDPPGFSTQGTTYSYELGTEVAITATANSGYKFDQWKGDVDPWDEDDKSITVTMDEPKDITATFNQETTEYELDIDTESGGEVEVDPPGYSTQGTTRSYEEGTEVTISAAPSSDYNFDKWEGDVPSWEDDEATITVSIDEAKNITATFVENIAEYSLDVEAKNGGEVSVDPPGISTDETTHTYEEGTEVTLTAQSDSGHRFDEWEGKLSPFYRDERSITITIDEDRSMAATFEEETPEYDIHLDTERGGNIEITPPGILTQGTTESYEEGTEVTLRANPDSGYDFAEWEGDVPYTDEDKESITVDVDESKDITAKFQEETTEYELDVESEMGGSAEINPPGISADETPYSYEEGTEVTIRAIPDSGYTFTEWEGDVPYADNDEESITVDIDEAKDITATFKQRVTQAVEISDITASNSTYSLGDTATITTRLTNDADTSQVADVSVELRPPDGEGLVKTDTKTIDGNDIISLSSQWNLSSSLATGQYDLTVRVTIDSEVIAETTRSNIFEVTESIGAVNVKIETVTAEGDPVDGARITLTPLDGGSDKSVVSSSGSAELSRVPPGEYDLTAESTQLNQELTFGLVVDGTSDLTREITFRPTDAIYGTVFNGEGQQHISEATVSIPELQETAETDAKGEFVFNSNIPDDTYEFEITIDPSNTIVADSEVNTFTKSREVDIDRTITFDIPVNLKKPDDDTSDLISEEDRLVSIVVRNLEKRDVLFPLEQQFITQYGFVKGIITGIQGFLEEIWTLLTNLDDIPEMIQGIIKLIELILEDPSIVFKLVSMMINNIVEKQENDNPFEKDTVEHQTFFGAWMLGYGGIKIAISIVGTKGATKVSKIAKSSSKLNKAVGNLKTKVDGGLPENYGLNRRISPCRIASGSISAVDAGNCINKSTIQRAEALIGDSDYSSLVRTALMIERRLQRNMGDNAPKYLDEFIDGKNVGRLKGKIGEGELAMKFLSRLPDNIPYDLNINPKIMKSLDDIESVPAGEARVLIPDRDSFSSTGEIEFDVIIVGKLPPELPEGGKSKIFNIWEVTTSGNKRPGMKKNKKVEDLVEIKSKLKNNDIEPDERFQGIPAKLFNDVDQNQIKVAGPKGRDGFDIELSSPANAYTGAARNLMENGDTYKPLTKTR